MKQKTIEEEYEYDNIVEFREHKDQMEEQGMELVSHKIIAIYRRKQ
jgi:hypothetical protein